MVRPKAKRPGILLPAGLILAGFLCVAANQARVQVSAREAVLERAEAVDRLFARQELTARRGDIYSADGRLLAGSSNSYRLGVDPKNLSMSPAMCAEVAKACGISAAELMDAISRKGRAGSWEILLTSHQAAQLRIAKTKYSADGVWIEPAGEREYPLGELAAPLLGYVSAGVGKAGIERSQERYLQGKDGKVIGMTDRSGNFLPWRIRRNDSHPAEHGADIVLTIDSDLQIAAMKSLAAQCEAHGAANGAAIVIDPLTGDILAMASWPTFDPVQAIKAQQLMADGKRVSPEMNPAVSMVFEPGSTFKIFTAALGFDEGIIKPDERVNCSGTKPFSVATIHCAGDHAPKSHGAVDARLAIEASCNVTAATWGVRIGFDRYSKLIEDLGLLERSGIGITPDARGKLDYTDYNKTIQMANIGFGQSVNVTPVGLASAFTVFANGGRRAYPRLIRSIGGAETPVRVSEQIFSTETAAAMLDLMSSVIHGEQGTGKSLRIPGYTLAGKTGTAQKPDPVTRRMGKGYYVSSFVGYVPAEQPRAVVLVIIDQPTRGGYYGGVVAGPVFKDIAKFLLQTWKVSPNFEPSEERVEAE